MNVQREVLLKFIMEGKPIQSYEIDYFSLAKVSRESYLDIDFTKISEVLLKYIIENDSSLSPEIRAEWSLKLHEIKPVKTIEDFFDEKVKNLEDIIKIYENHLKNLSYNFDYYFDNKPIPVFADIILHNATKYDPRYIEAIYHLKLHKTIITKSVKFTYKDILSLKHQFDKLTFGRLFSLFSLSPQKISINLYEKQVIQKNEKQLENGKQYLSTGFGYASIHSVALNLKQDKVIIENELETEFDRYRENKHVKHVTDIPYVRVFSLDKKRYFFVHIDELKPYIFNENAIEKLILDQKNKSIVNKIFSSKMESFDDLSHNKGKGIIILAVGEAGTGKTSTAEVFAEFHKKSLYILQVDELGVDIKSVEKNLMDILNRISSWKSVLLIDEADIFLSHRNNDLERSAIVGIFLRLFEYFKGVLFLTSNRLDVIDAAVLSRVTLVLKYPNLTKETRLAIWAENFKSAGIKINQIKALATVELSGRDIRNYVKLLHYMESKEVSEDSVMQLIEDYPKN